MESDKPDLNSILESARAQLEMYRRASQEELNEPNKEMLLTRSRDQEMEDISGPLFDRARESSADSTSARAASGKSIESRNQTVDTLKDSKNSTELDDDSEIVDDEESSNKNFDSSTMTFGDQQSFQNQTELTSQTTYTNIHELTGPVKEDIIVVTGPTTEQLSSALSQISHPEQTTSETTASESVTAEVTTTSDDVHKTDQLQHNQMDGTTTVNQDWKSEESHRDSLQEITETERNREEETDKTDVEVTAGAGTREGSPVPNRMSLHEVVQKLSQLEIDSGTDSNCLNRIVSEKDVDVCEENVNEISKESTTSVSDSDSVKNDCNAQGSSLFDNPPVSLNVNAFENSVDNRQMEFVEHYEENEVDNYEGNFRKSSDKSVFEDEGFVDSKDFLDSTKIIFISDQEDEQSSKPFETEDDNSCMLEPSSAGRSLDLQSDLEAKPSLTDVHQDQGNHLENNDVVSDSERALSLDLVTSNTDEQNSATEESNACQDTDSNPNNGSDALTLQTCEDVGSKQFVSPNDSKDSKQGPQSEESQYLHEIQEQNPSQSDPTDNIVSKKARDIGKDCAKGHQDKQRDANTTKTPEKHKTPPKVVQVHNKDPNVSGDQNVPTKQPLCIGKLIFEALLKNINKDNTKVPSNLAALLQSYSASKEAKNIHEITVISSSDSLSGTDTECPDQKVTVGVNSDQNCNDQDDSVVVRSSPVRQRVNKLPSPQKDHRVTSSSPRRSTNSPNLLIRPSTPMNVVHQRNLSADSESDTDNEVNSPASNTSKNRKPDKVAAKPNPEAKADDVEILKQSKNTSTKIQNSKSDEKNSRSVDQPTTPKIRPIRGETTLVSSNLEDAETSAIVYETNDFPESIQTLPESSESNELRSYARSSEDNSQISETSSDRSSVGSMHRPLTPYVSDLNTGMPEFQEYMQGPPAVPSVRHPTPIGNEMRVRIHEHVDNDNIDSGISTKVPPRPPPRMRQSPQPKKSTRLSFFKRLFGVKSKQGN